MIESCESRIANLLAKIQESRKYGVSLEEINYQITILVECVEIQAKEIEDLKRRVHE